MVLSTLYLPNPYTDIKLTPPYVIRYSHEMNDMQRKIADIQEKGWTLAALADELEISLSALEKWKAGATYPRNSKAVMLLLERIEHRNRIPKQRRYKPGSRRQG